MVQRTYSGGGGGGGADNGDGGGNGGAPGGGGGAGTVCDNGTQCQGADGQIYITWETPAPPSVTQTISGTIYIDEGTTVSTSNEAVKAYVATSSTSVATSTTADGSGNFSFIGFDEFPTAGVPVTLWVDNDTSFRASAVTVASSTSNDITGLHLYQNRVIIKHESESATSTTIAKLGLYDGDNDSDIQFSVDASNNLTVKAGQMLYIWPGTHFDSSSESGGTITTHGGVSGNNVDGDIKLARGFHPAAPAVATSTILTLGSGGLSLAGSYFASSSAILDAGTASTIFTATTTGKSIYASSTPFYNITFDGVDGTAGGWTFQEMASSTNNFLITDGTVVAPDWLSIAGNFTNNGTFTAGTGTTTFNGTAAQTISGTLTGSSALANVEFNNPFATSGDWYNADWMYRKKITLKQASTTLTNYPALISLSDTDLAAHAQADGDDILFTSSDGTTRLNHDLDEYNSGGGVTAWVDIPSLSSSAATDIYMYYGNAATSSENLASTTWDSSYVAIYHFEEDPPGTENAEYLDSTNNDHGGWDLIGDGNSKEGNIGRGQGFGASSAANDDWVGTDEHSDFTLAAGDHSFEGWFKAAEQVAGSGFGVLYGRFTGGSPGAGYFFGVRDSNSNLELDYRADGGDTLNLSSDDTIHDNFEDDTWHYFAVSIDVSEKLGTLYIDGNLHDDDVYTGDLIDKTGYPESAFFMSAITWDSPGDHELLGSMDEVRFTKGAARSADWFAISYDNVIASSTFYTAISAEETDSGGDVAATGITFANNASTTHLMILQGGLKAPSLLSISGNYKNDAGFNANSGTTTFNGTGQQYISGFATGTNAFAGLNIINTTSSTTFTAVASSTTLFASAGARIEFASGATEQTPQDTGWVVAGAGAEDTSVGTAGWTSPENITSDDTNRATRQSTGNSYYLYADQFDFSSIPDTATIVGVEVRRQAHSGSGSINDASIRLFNASGSPEGNDKSEAAAWSTTVDTVVSFGGADDTWGVSLSPSIVKDPDFGWGLAVSGSLDTANVDVMEMKIHYTTSGTVPGTTTVQNISLNGSGGNEIYLHSATPGTQWNFEVPGGRSVSYVNVKDSNACYTSGNDIIASNATDGGNNSCWDITAPIGEPGTLTLADSDAGQISDQFNSSSVADVVLLRFKTTPADEAITTTYMFKLNAYGVKQSDITNVQLFPDYQGDGNKDGDDPEDPVGGSGTVSISGNSGTITFSSFSTSTAMNYVLEGDVADITSGNELIVRLIAGNVTAVGDASGESIIPSGTVTNADHIREGGKAIGAGGKVGDTSTPQAKKTGGDEGGGESLGDDDDNKAPASSGTPSNFWSSGGSGIASDSSYASETTDDEGLNFNAFGFNVPDGDTINGIEIKIEASCVTTCGTIDVALAWDNDGANATTTAKNTGTLTTTDTIYTLGDSTDTWGRSWSASEFSDANFSVEVTAQPSGSNAVRIDAITARVYHQASGGGGGGGGRSSLPERVLATVIQSDIIKTIKKLFF